MRENKAPHFFESFTATMGFHLPQYKGPWIWAQDIIFEFLYMEW